MTEGLGFAVLAVLQIALLVMFYGFGVIMPWWVVWFPLLFILFCIGMLIVFLIMIAMMAIIFS
jgi:hypothetical protein